MGARLKATQKNARNSIPQNQPFAGYFRLLPPPPTVTAGVPKTVSFIVVSSGSSLVGLEEVGTLLGAITSTTNATWIPTSRSRNRPSLSVAEAPIQDYHEVLKTEECIRVLSDAFPAEELFRGGLYR